MTTSLRRVVAAASLGLAAATGCHKNPPVAYTPPPPLASAPARSPGRATSPNAADRIPAPVVRPPAPAIASEARGKPVLTEVGLASWYGPPYAGRKGADGAVFDGNAMTAAHRTLPLGTTVRVTNLETEQSVVVKITDRGPFVQGRMLDLSLAAAKAIGVYRTGTAKVRVEAFAHPAADPEGRWCVQIGAFLDPDEAVQLKNDLMQRYHTAKVIEFAGPTGYWVRINPAQPDKTTASRIADSIHIPDADPYLVRTN